MKIKKIINCKKLSGQTVLVRVDFNVPIKNSKVADNFRIKKTLPTIKYLLHNNARVILVSHLGRPIAGKFEKKFSLAPVAEELQKLLGKKVDFFKLEDLEKTPNNGSVTLLENIRFIKGEEENDPVLSKRLSNLADLFVMDGFAVSHRKSASVCGVAKYLPAYAGLLMTQELEGLIKAVNKPKKPLTVILGGAKSETKIPILKNLLPRATYILVAGAIANTYFSAKGIKIGNSICDKNFQKEILKICTNKKIILPTDVVVGTEKGKEVEVKEINKSFKIKKTQSIYDVGPASINNFAKYIKKANTIIINGALGWFEQKPYNHGTYAILTLVAMRSKGKAFGVAGGGETVETLNNLHLSDQMDLVSTGGGAMLEYLSGKKLPGVEVLLY